MSQVWERNDGRARAAPTTRFPNEPMELLSPESKAFFETAYELTNAARYITEAPKSRRYCLTIWGPHGTIRGVVLRRPWTGSPLEPALAGYPKADTYKYVEREPLQSWYRHDDSYWSDDLVVVEDQLSAIKLAAHGYDSVALLGKPDVEHGAYSGADRIREIAQQARDREVIVALDADATGVAFQFVRKWGHAFQRIRVAILAKDLKDTAGADFAEVLGA